MCACSFEQVCAVLVHVVFMLVDVLLCWLMVCYVYLLMLFDVG